MLLFVGERADFMLNQIKKHIWLIKHLIPLKSKTYWKKSKNSICEKHVTCRILVNHHAFHFYQTLCLSMICFLNSWKQNVKTFVQWGASLIEVLSERNNWLIIFFTYKFY